MMPKVDPKYGGLLEREVASRAEQAAADNVASAKRFEGMSAQQITEALRKDAEAKDAAAAMVDERRRGKTNIMGR
jgi:hypothetical protein